jgi:integrase/recombinase XerD
LENLLQSLSARSIYRKPVDGLKSQTKGDVARTIYLNEKIQSLLQSWTDAMWSGDSKQFVFESQKGGCFNTNALTQLIRSIYIEAGFKGASSHSGRRKFVTTLHDRGVPVRHIQKLVGHAHLSTTQAYIDAPESKLKDAVSPL